MALKTFDNLPEMRRTEILERCFMEFSEKGYEGASIAAIIADLGLARGSFYRYFEDKQDLYRYLYTHAMDLSIKGMEGGMADGETDYLDVWKANLMAFADKTGGYPAFMSFLSRASQERRPEVFAHPETRGFEKRIDMVESHFKTAADKGKARTDIDPGLMALVFMHGRYAIGQYMARRMKTDKIKPGTKKFKDILQKAVDGFLEITRRGIEGGAQ